MDGQLHIAGHGWATDGPWTGDGRAMEGTLTGHGQVMVLDKPPNKMFGATRHYKVKLDFGRYAPLLSK